MTLEYWHNLSEKHFSHKRLVSKKDLLRAVTISDPDNSLVFHPPISNSKVVQFSLLYAEDFGAPATFINAGSIDIELFFSTPSENIIKTVKAKFQKNLETRGISEEHISGIRWGMGGEPKLNDLEFFGAIDYLSLINAVKNDVYLRKELSKKYDDFLEILNQEK